MIFHFILNPNSGRHLKHRMLEEEIKEACMKRQLSYHIYYTTCAGDAIEYVKSMLRISQDRLDSKNFYAFNPSFDKSCNKKR